MKHHISSKMDDLGNKPRLASRFFGFLTVFLAAAGTIWMLLRVHDYPQTAQSLVEIQEGRNYGHSMPLFYFLNEAGSGLKYALTGNPKHFRFFPTMKFIREKRLEFIGSTIMHAAAGNWCAQLRISGIYAGSGGYAKDIGKANRWFALAYVRAREQAAPERDLFMHELMLFEKTFGVELTTENLQWAQGQAESLSGRPLGCQLRPAPAASPAT